MFTITVWMDDHKLLQESNLTAWQPCRALITLYISFNKTHRLENEGLVNFTWDMGREPWTRTWFANTTHRMLSTTLWPRLVLWRWIMAHLFAPLTYLPCLPAWTAQQNKSEGTSKTGAIKTQLTPSNLMRIIASMRVHFSICDSSSGLLLRCWIWRLRSSNPGCNHK